jgi:hypothetical protein
MLPGESKRLVRFADPQFLRKEPFAQKTVGRGRGKLMGFRVEEFGSSS